MTPKPKIAEAAVKGRRIAEREELARYRAAKSGRAAAIAERNKTDAEATRAGIRKALSHFSTHGVGIGALAEAVIEHIRRNGPAHFGLRRLPCRETVEAVIRAARNPRTGAS